MVKRGDSHELVAAQVLQIMVQHVENLSTRDVARLLQLSSTCRRALQQAVGCLKIDDCQINSLAAITGLAAWLPHHAGLLQEVALFRRRKWIPPSTASPTSPDDDARWGTAEQLMVFALQNSSTPPAGPAAAAAGDPQALSRPAPLLRLQSFSSDYVYNPATLHSLATCSSLTALDLTRIPQQRFTAALCSAIAQLRYLRKLECSFAGSGPWVCPSNFCSIHSAADTARGPRCTLLAPSSGPVAAAAQLDRSHTRCGVPSWRQISRHQHRQLSKLQTLMLSLNKRGRLSAQSQLPDSLTNMALVGGAGAVPGLGQLQYLHLRLPGECLALLRRLPQLPTLQHVKLGLRYCRQEHLEPVLAALAAATKLTGLQLYFSDQSQEFDGMFADRLVDMQNILLHSYLKKLPRLQGLQITGLELNEADVAHFTALTALTYLRIADCRGKLDLGIAAIMQRLTGLRVLYMESLALSNRLIWVSAACLTNLQDLQCTNCNAIAVTDDTLHLLAPLTNLTSLMLDAGDEIDGVVRHNVSRSAAAAAAVEQSH